MKVRPAVKKACLDKFIQRVQLKYSIAFFQWRYLFVPGLDKQQLIENIETVSNNFYRNNCITKSVTPETQAAAQVSFEFEGKYNLVMLDDELIKETPWFIHSFWALGLADPFPDESTVLDTVNACNDPKVPFS